MKTEHDWKAERWEGDDFIVTGFGFNHSGTYTKREAELIVEALIKATPLIQRDALKEMP